jgi:PHD/YefM family antitoxin component YafN of YafNO toxin-antitoxin module
LAAVQRWSLSDYIGDCDMEAALELDVSNTAFCRSNSAVYILSHSKLFAVVILVSEELIRLEETENERVKFKCNQDLLIEIMPDKSERVFKKSS